MNFVEVDKIPKNGSTRKIEIKKLLDDFLKSKWNIFKKTN